MTKKNNRGFVVVVILLVAALAVEGAMMRKPKKAQTLDPKDLAARQKAIQSGDPITYFGDKAAPIKIEFYAPLVLEWHKKTIGLLRDYDKKHPKRISVKLMPMGNSECDTEMVSRGFTCAVIFINGKHEFTLPNGKKVDLQKKPNTADSFYNSEDVITIIDHLK